MLPSRATLRMNRARFVSVSFRMGLAFIILSSFLFSCISNTKDETLEMALNNAGDHKKELKKVLNHYADDSLKYAAARYLILEMSGQYLASFQNDDYDLFTTQVFDSLSFLGHSMYTSKDTIINKMLRVHAFEKIWDHYADQYGTPEAFQYAQKLDLHHISADFLIENIDDAFKAWQLPWSRHYTFDEFCRYILPYRYANESLSPWRKAVWDKYGHLMDSISELEDPVKAAIYINNHLKLEFWGSDKLKTSPTRLKGVDLVKGMLAGTCEDQVGIGYVIMRAFGIATSEIIIPNWGNRLTLGHNYNAILDPIEGKWVDFHAGDINPLDNNMTLMPKAFLKSRLHTGDSLNRLAYLEQMIDLTAQLTKTVDVMVEIDSSVVNNKYAYLCVFNSKSWQPIMWAKIDAGKATFIQMGVDKVYLPVVYEGGEQIPIGSPILIDSLGNQQYLAADLLNKTSATLYRKYLLAAKTLQQRTSDLVGGRFEVANKADFSDAKVMYTIPIFTEYVPVHQKVNEIKGRYVRFVFPSIDRQFKDGAAMIQFYGKDQGTLRSLKGEVMSSSPISAKNVQALFDDNPLTFINFLPTDVDLPQDFWTHVAIRDTIKPFWVGMDLGKIEAIQQIAYCARNDKNDVYPGLIYELFYWDGKWVSLGSRRPNSHHVAYDNLPVNALYLLKCLDEGVEERIFTVDHKGDQIWW
jgi:hypothetical protein